MIFVHKYKFNYLKNLFWTVKIYTYNFHKYNKYIIKCKFIDVKFINKILKHEYLVIKNME